MVTDKSQTTSAQAVVSSDGARKGSGAFGFAAMMRSGAYDPSDAEMCAAKFEALGNEIERLLSQRDRLVTRLRDAGLSTPFEAMNGDEQMQRNTSRLRIPRKDDPFCGGTDVDPVQSSQAEPTAERDASEIADMLIEVERCRLQHRIDACLERHGGDFQAAVTSSGIGISFLFARDIVLAFDHAEREIARLRKGAP